MEQPDTRTGSAAPEPNLGPSSSPTGATDAANPGQGITDRARDIAGVTRDKLADVGGTVRDRVGTIKDSLADALESGADKLRNRTPDVGGGALLAGNTPQSQVAGTIDRREDQVSATVAGSMEATANWLRDADLDSIKASIERQVKEHPGRTLLIAVGLGYLLGKALRK